MNRFIEFMAATQPHATSFMRAFLIISVGLMTLVGFNRAFAQSSVICELEVGDAGGVRAAEELEFETFNTDPNLETLWLDLFGAVPGTSPDDLVTLQSDTVVTWEMGMLEMGGVMRLKVKTDKLDPSLKTVEIKKAGKKDGTTLFVSGTGGVNPNIADGGWHEVEVENMGGVTVYFDGYAITGFLKKLEVELDENSTLATPVVEEFELKIIGATLAPDVKKGTVTSIVVDVPETVVTALAGIEYEEEIEEKPQVLQGHTEAEFEMEEDATTEGVDISTLIDGNNDLLEEREGPCSVTGIGGGGGGSGGGGGGGSTPGAGGPPVI